MIGYTVLGGYLGAGKTTLLNNLLKNANGQRLALLINDFGSINIDAQLIESQDDQQINLANGCVCCTLRDGMYAALESLQELQPPPDHIVVEASGVADVSQLAQYGFGNRLKLNGVVVLADAETVRQKAQDKYVAETVKRQLLAADILLLNKTDLLESDKLTAVEEWLENLVSGVPILRCVQAQVPMEIVLGDIYQPKDLLNSHNHSHVNFQTWAAEDIGPLAKEDVEEFVDKLPKQVVRAKGFFKLNTGEVLELQKVGARTALTPSTVHKEAGELVAICDTPDKHFATNMQQLFLQNIKLAAK